MTARALVLVIALAAVAASHAPAGFDDLELYVNASRRFVGAQKFLSFSSASAHGPNGQVVDGHGLPAPEAFCACACHGIENFVYCQSTAKTTVGISTFWLESVDAPDRDQVRWRGRGLRYFGAGSQGSKSGRTRTSFTETARLPDGPGGSIFFEVAYMNDDDASTSPHSRSAELVRGRTAPVSCDAHALCDRQCSGVAQYEAWRRDCGAP